MHSLPYKDSGVGAIEFGGGLHTRSFEQRIVADSGRQQHALFSRFWLLRLDSIVEVSGESPEGVERVFSDCS